MADNKTVPTKISVKDYLLTVVAKRQSESDKIINLMHKISGLNPVMWGPSIIGFGSQHYRYEIGREGEVPILAFSPRKSALTIYFNEGFDNYGDLLNNLGKYKLSSACLYINKLEDIDANVLSKMLKKSFNNSKSKNKPVDSVDEYIKRVPDTATAHFNELRQLIKTTLPNSKEVLSYGVVGYKIDDKRAKVFIAGWKDHIGLYPLPKDASLQKEIQPYVKGKGTMWFMLDKPLPKNLIKKVIASLTR